MTKSSVAIIGGGLAGLNCARLLDTDFNVTIFEKGLEVGGRVLSTHQDGYIFDHGFQVFLPGYPEARLAFDYDKLDLHYFTPGALIKVGQNFHAFSDPLRDPKNILKTFFAPIGNFKDKLLILKLKQAVKNIDPKLKNMSTLDYLKSFGFSDSMINGFFKPFFSGVFLERELKTSAYFFSFLFSLFSKCNASVPKNGMAELPKNLLEQLKNAEVKLGSSVDAFTKSSVTVNGEKTSFDYVVTAYDQESKDFQIVTTDYYAADQAVEDSPTLFLNGEAAGIINHIAPMSVVNKNYSPKGQYLYSVNTLSPHHDAPVSQVTAELKNWFLEVSFTHLSRYTVKKALPAQPSYGSAHIINDGVYRCGDQMQTPSIDGALKSGRLAAELIIKNS